MSMPPPTMTHAGGLSEPPGTNGLTTAGGLGSGEEVNFVTIHVVDFVSLVAAVSQRVGSANNFASGPRYGRR
jgi:hypothetical protein